MLGTIFSMPASTMWMRGRVCVRSPLPSLVTMVVVPLSAIRKLAPVMPTSATRKRPRSLTRASCSRLDGSLRLRLGSRSVWTLRKVSSTWSLVTCTDGAMMWLGASPRSWMMYSPRSVSIGSMPLAARWSLMPISSPTMVLPLVTVLAPAPWQMSRMILRASAGVAAQCTWPPYFITLPSNSARYSSSRLSTWFLRSRPASRSASNSGSAAIACWRLSMNLVRTWPSACCRCASFSARVTLSLKRCAVDSIGLLPLADRGPVGHAGQHLGDVARLDLAAGALQLAGDVEQAPHVRRQHHVGAGRFDVGDLVRDHAVGDVGELDAERAAEAAARLAVRQLLEVEAANLGQQFARLALDLQLAQRRAGIVIGHRLRERRRHPVPLRHVAQELRQLIGLVGQRARTRGERRIARQQLWVMRLDHAAAGARRRHHIVEALERGNDLARDRERALLVAGIVARLAAAGLRLRHDHGVGPAALDQRDRRETHGRPIEIDQAGDEQADALAFAHERACWLSQRSPTARGTSTQ